MMILIGLGNPGKQYNNTYHNIGFAALDNFADSHNLVFSQKKYHSQVAKGVVAGRKVLLLKPQTYMNLSGKAVAEVVRKLKLPTSNIIIICDDVDLPAGTVRLRMEGSAGTHNGLRSIAEHLGTTDFPRVKIGVGRDDNMPLDAFVLSKITRERLQLITDKFPQINSLLEKFIVNQGNIEGETV